MYMGRVRDSRDSWIHLYKNRSTRQYLCIDEGGYLRERQRERDGAITWAALHVPPLPDAPGRPTRPEREPPGVY
jgi:hypothetical protein